MMMVQINHQKRNFSHLNNPTSIIPTILLHGQPNTNNTNKTNNTSSTPKRNLSTQYEQEAEAKSKKDRMTQILIDVIDAKPRPPPKHSPEEAQRRYNIGRNYVIGNFKRHNELHHDLACKIKLKNHAIALLPKKDDEKFGYLKQRALEVDISSEAMPPYYRPIPVDTPPIPDFDPSIFLEEEED